MLSTLVFLAIENEKNFSVEFRLTWDDDYDQLYSLVSPSKAMSSRLIDYIQTNGRGFGTNYIWMQNFESGDLDADELFCFKERRITNDEIASIDFTIPDFTGTAPTNPIIIPELDSMLNHHAGDSTPETCSSILQNVSGLITMDV